MNEVKNLKKNNALQQELKELKESLNNDKTDPVGTFKINPVNHSRENAELAKVLASGIKGTLEYYDPTFDPRLIDDDSFERDNNLIKLADPGNEASVCILRDNAGRCDMGGPTKWRDGSLDELGRWL